MKSYCGALCIYLFFIIIIIIMCNSLLYLYSTSVRLKLLKYHLRSLCLKRGMIVLGYHICEYKCWLMCTSCMFVCYTQARGSQASHQVLRDIVKEVHEAMVPRTMLRDWALTTYPNPTHYWTFRKIVSYFNYQMSLNMIFFFLLYRYHSDSVSWKYKISL